MNSVDFRAYVEKVHDTFKLVHDTFGSQAVERPGFLFLHASAVQDGRNQITLKLDCTKYPTLSVSD